MRIGELAERTGTTPRALRYYEEQGLLRPERTESGYREYPSEAAPLVCFVQNLYAAGFISKDIARLLDLTRGTVGTDSIALRNERERILGRMAQLQSALHRVDRLLAAMDNDAPDDGARIDPRVDGVGSDLQQGQKKPLPF